MENLQKFYINGEWVNPLSDATMAVLNPATEQQIGLVALGNDADVDRAVAAANAAFEGFSQTSKDPALRAEMAALAGATSVPQIWIGDQHVGGCDELYSLERRQQLDSLLRIEAP